MLNAVLEHPVLRQQIIPMSVSTYQALGQMGLVEERTELIRGFVLPKMSKSPRHSIVTQRLLNWLRRVFPSGFSIRQEQPITCFDSEPESDVALVKGADEDFAYAHPTTAALVVEVAVSSLERDRAKTSIYAEIGVSEYWLVNPDAGWIEQYTGPSPDGYQQCRRLKKTDTLVCATFPDIQISISELLA